MHTECLPPTPGRSSWSMLSPYTVQEPVSPGKQRRGGSGPNERESQRATASPAHPQPRPHSLEPPFEAQMGKVSWQTADEWGPGALGAGAAQAGLGG